jgi:hypothetical protein
LLSTYPEGVYAKLVYEQDAVEPAPVVQDKNDSIDIKDVITKIKENGSGSESEDDPAALVTASAN